MGTLQKGKIKPYGCISVEMVKSIALASTSGGIRYTYKMRICSKQTFEEVKKEDTNQSITE